MLLWYLLVLLIILWVAGFGLHIGGNLVHLLLIIAVVVLIYQLVTGRRD